MSYTLGVDLGTARSAAAIDQGGRLRPCALSDDEFTVSSVLRRDAGGRLRLGDDDATDAGPDDGPDHGHGHANGNGEGNGGRVTEGSGAAGSLAGLLTAIVDRVSAQQGAPPAEVVLARPGSHATVTDGPYDSLAGAVGGRARLVPAPVAALTKADRTGRLRPGALVAVLDLAQDLAETSVVRNAGGGFEVVGQPVQAPGVVGQDIDSIVLARVDAALDGAVTALHRSAAGPSPVVSRLRASCRQATRVVTRSSEATIEVALPKMPVRVRLTPDDFQRIVSNRMTSLVTTLECAIDAASLRPADLDGVVLVGEQARLPLAGHLVSERLGRPVIVEPAPELTVAFGAALLGSAARGRRPGAPGDGARRTTWAPAPTTGPPAAVHDVAPGRTDDRVPDAAADVAPDPGTRTAAGSTTDTAPGPTADGAPGSGSDAVPGPEAGRTGATTDPGFSTPSATTGVEAGRPKRARFLPGRAVVRRVATPAGEPSSLSRRRRASRRSSAARAGSRPAEPDAPGDTAVTPVTAPPASSISAAPSPAYTDPAQAHVGTSAGAPGAIRPSLPSRSPFSSCCDHQEAQPWTASSTFFRLRRLNRPKRRWSPTMPPSGERPPRSSPTRVGISASAPT